MLPSRNMYPVSLYCLQGVPDYDSKLIFLEALIELLQELTCVFDVVKKAT